MPLSTASVQDVLHNVIAASSISQVLLALADECREKAKQSADPVDQMMWLETANGIDSTECDLK